MSTGIRPALKLGWSRQTGFGEIESRAQFRFHASGFRVPLTARFTELIFGVGAARHDRAQHEHREQGDAKLLQAHLSAP
jgi:hypothetical protein